MYHLNGESLANRIKIASMTMQHIESELEKQCRAYARTHGCVAWKNEKNGNKGIPDDSFLTPSGRFFMVEFKKSKNAKVRPEQLLWKQRFPQLIHFVNDYTDFVNIIDNLTKTEK